MYTIVVKNLLFGKWMNLLIVWNCSGALGKLTPLKREDPTSLRNNGMHSLIGMFRYFWLNFLRRDKRYLGLSISIFCHSKIVLLKKQCV